MTPSGLQEEGFAAHRRGVGTTPVPPITASAEGYRHYGRGLGSTEAVGRAVIVVGAPVATEGFVGRGVNTQTGAWMPPTAGVASSDYGYGTSRYSPSGNGVSRNGGGYSGSNSGSSSGSNFGNSASAAGSSSGASSAASAPSASEAQAQRSAESRATVQSQRPPKDP